MDNVKQGQDQQLSKSVGIRVEVDGESRWFRVPWMACDPTAEGDGIYGSTNQHRIAGWLGVHYQWGGDVVGQARLPSGQSEIDEFPGNPVPNGLPLSRGKGAANFLTMNAPVRRVPDVAGLPEWQSDRSERSDPGEHLCDCRLETTRRIRADMAVLVHRTPTRHVDRTFGYSAQAEADTVWDHLIPVGVLCGSERWIFPAAPEADSLPARLPVT